MLQCFFFIFATLPLTGMSKPYQEELRCTYDWNCPVDTLYCAGDTKSCRCKLERPVPIAYNPYCVPALKLGERCDYSDSCRYFDVNSFCHTRRGCMCIEGFRPMKLYPYENLKCVQKEKRYGYWPYEDDSDEDDDDSDDDDDDDDDDKVVRSDIATPIIVGIVLGSAIVCGWSCAICRIYLKKMEKQKKRAQCRRIRRLKANARRLDSNPDFPDQTEYTLLPSQPVQLNLINESHSIAVSSIPVMNTSNESVPLNVSNCTQISVQFSPDEEPLPGYEVERKESPETECPPSYEEVMREANKEKPDDV